MTMKTEYPQINTDRSHGGSSYLTLLWATKSPRSSAGGIPGRDCRWGYCVLSGSHEAMGSFAWRTTAAVRRWKYQMTAASAMKNAQPSPTPTPIPTFACGDNPSSLQVSKDAVDVESHSWAVDEGDAVVLALFAVMLKSWHINRVS